MSTNKEIRDAACEKAKHTWVVDFKDKYGRYSHSIIVGYDRLLENWPKDEPSMLSPERLLREFGVTGDYVPIRLSESEQAPQPWTPEDELRSARRSFEYLRARQAAEGRATDQMVTEAQKHLAELEEQLSTEPEAEAIS